MRTNLRHALPAVSAVCGAASGAAGQSTLEMRAEDGGVIVADADGDGERGVVLAAAGYRVIAIDCRAAVEARAGRETLMMREPRP